MEFDNQRPIYLQLLEEFKLKISTGQWQAGEKIESVRSLAQTYEVNPNTVQKALAELEREGLTETRRTAGRFVTEDIKMLENLEDDAFKEIADNFIAGASSLNMDKATALKELDKYWEEDND